jgi:outer membrane protein, heavy metal efflux system
MKIGVFLLAIGLIPALNITGQGTDAFLREVEAKHPVLKSIIGQTEVARAESVTGNTPGHFSVGFGYFPGTPETMGVKRTLSASQSFEFPTNYIQRAKFNRETFHLAETEYDLERVQILVAARANAYEYISLGRQIVVLEEKLNGYTQLREAWSELLRESAVTQPEYNRLQLELSITASEIASIQATKKSLQIHLDYISGGNCPLLNEASYDMMPEPDIELLIAEKRKLHPSFLIRDVEYAASQRAVSLTRAGNLPDVDLGFGSEIIAGEHYTGPTAGLSIPLWTNRNQLKLAKTKVEAAELSRQAAHAALVAEVHARFEYFQAARENFLTMREGYSAMGDTSGLMEALAEKELTITEYLSHMEAVYTSRITVIKLEKEYQLAHADLYDHLLIK